MVWNKEFNFDIFEFKLLDDRFKRVYQVYLSFVQFVKQLIMIFIKKEKILNIFNSFIIQLVE